jgi:hypothetical protein
MLGLLLLILGLVLWLALGYVVIGIILTVVGAVLLFGGNGPYYGRRGFYP